MTELSGHIVLQSTSMSDDFVFYLNDSNVQRWFCILSMHTHSCAHIIRTEILINLPFSCTSLYFFHILNKWHGCNKSLFCSSHYTRAIFFLWVNKAHKFSFLHWGWILKPGQWVLSGSGLLSVIGSALVCTDSVGWCSGHRLLTSMKDLNSLMDH